MNDVLLTAFFLLTASGYLYLLNRMAAYPALAQSLRMLPNRFYFYLVTTFISAVFMFLLAKTVQSNWLVTAGLLLFELNGFLNLAWLGLNFNRARGWVVRPVAFAGLVGTGGWVIVAFALGQREQPANFVGDNVHTDLHFWHWVGFSVGLVYMLVCQGRAVYEALHYAAGLQNSENDGTKYRLYVLSFLSGSGALYFLVVLIQITGSFLSGSLEFDSVLMVIRDLTFLPIFLSITVLFFADQQLFRLYLRFYRYRQGIKFAKLRPFFEEVHRQLGGFIRLNPYEFAADKMGSNAKGEQTWRLVAAITGLEDVRKHIWWTEAWIKAAARKLSIEQVPPVQTVSLEQEARLWQEYLATDELKIAARLYTQFATPPNALPPLPARSFDDRVDYYVKFGEMVLRFRMQELVRERAKGNSKQKSKDGVVS